MRAPVGRSSGESPARSRLRNGRASNLVAAGWAIPALAVLLVTVVLARWAVVAALVLVVVVSALVGTVVVRALHARDHAQAQVTRLLQAVRVLARVDDERRGAEIIASLSAHLLDADAVAVLLSGPAGSSRLLNRAWFGHPALADAAPLVVDVRDLEADVGVDLAAGSARFFRDARGAHVLATTNGGGRIRSAVLLPVRGEDAQPVGLIVAMWGTARRTLPTAGLPAAELVSEESGRMFERLRESAALARDAQTDPLTHLANRRTFAHALATLRPDDAVAIIDLDHFKSVNDRFGHDRGDEVLRALAGCLSRVARQMDCVARYGGEEFALVLPEAGGAGALLALRRARAAWSALDPVTTFSAGIAVHETGEDAATTLKRADTALYEAKGAGRDRDVLAPAIEIVLG